MTTTMWTADLPKTGYAVSVSMGNTTACVFIEEARFGRNNPNCWSFCDDMDAAKVEALSLAKVVLRDANTVRVDVLVDDRSRMPLLHGYTTWQTLTEASEAGQMTLPFGNAA